MIIIVINRDKLKANNHDKNIHYCLPTCDIINTLNNSSRLTLVYLKTSRGFTL